MSLKQIKKDVPQCRMIVSYADVDQHHLGTIYQATNWIYTGQSDGMRYFVINGIKTHPKTVWSRIVTIEGKRRRCPQTIEAVRQFFDKDATIFESKGKRKYLMPLDKEIRKRIAPLAKPYPKENPDWTKIDRSTFTNSPQGHISQQTDHTPGRSGIVANSNV